MEAAASSAEALRRAAHRLGQHPQDHGWRELYRLFAHGLGSGRAPQLIDLAEFARAARPHDSDVHVITLLGIAVKSALSHTMPVLLSDRPYHDRLAVLEPHLEAARAQIEDVLASRNNSFTGVRRFLVPQVLLAARFADRSEAVRFADLGTGLGVLPRQLNCRHLFERFAPALEWPEGQPLFRAVPLEARFAVDRPPLPDLDWVRECYGVSDYYDEAYRELVEVVNMPEVMAAEVTSVALDFTDYAALTHFIVSQRINAVCLSYALYELAPPLRRKVLRILLEALHDPGFIVVIEPNGGLTRQGCTVTVHERATQRSFSVCAVSDGHFRGRVMPLSGYRAFVDNHPILPAGDGRSAYAA